MAKYLELSSEINIDLESTLGENKPTEEEDENNG